MDTTIFDEIHGYMIKPKSIYCLHKNLKELVEKSLKIMFSDISNSEKDFELEKSDYKIIEDSIISLIASTVHSEITADFKIFIKNYAFLVFNWNENIYKNESLKSNCQHLTRFSDDALLVSEFINYCNEISSKLNNASNLDIPSFKLSEHYFNIIKEE